MTMDESTCRNSIEPLQEGIKYLKDVPTWHLVAELCKREGVGEIVVLSGDYAYIKVDGAARILVMKE